MNFIAFHNIIGEFKFPIHLLKIPIYNRTPMHIGSLCLLCARSQQLIVVNGNRLQWCIFSSSISKFLVLKFS